MAGSVGADLCVRPGSFERRPYGASHRGDLAALLRLPESHPVWPPQEVEIRRVVGPDGQIVTPDPASPVLLLGDSFTNVYSDESLGWGAGAGLAEQLSFELGFAVDRISQNAGGAAATRRELAARLARGERPLAGKRVVIYQLAARELAVGDWALVEYREGEAPEAPPSDGPIRIEGQVQAVAPVPDPATTPYTQALVAIHLTDVSGAEADELLVYAWGMKDRERMPAARLAPEEVVELEIVPWRTVSDELGSVQRLELGDPELWKLEPWWVEEIDGMAQ